MGFLLDLILIYIATMVLFSTIAFLCALFDYETGMFDLFSEILLRIFYTLEDFFPQPKLLDGNNNATVTADDKSSEIWRNDSINPIDQLANTCEIKSDIPISSRAEDEENQIFTKSYKDYSLEFSMELTRWGVEAVMEDPISLAFTPCKPSSWNLMMRKLKFFPRWRRSVLLFWLLGAWFRYTVLVPFRICLFCTVIFAFLFSVGVIEPCITDPQGKRNATGKITTALCRAMLTACPAMTTIYHDTITSRKGTVCVVNHTSPCDFFILNSICQFATVGQHAEGCVGVIQRLIARAIPSLWFDKSVDKDRNSMPDKIREHCDAIGPPVLLFPEGACVNNTAICQFSKGAFQVPTTFIPVFVKYDPHFGDPFWHQESSLGHLAAWMSSWMMKADVYFLKPMRAHMGEEAERFAERVRSTIGDVGQLNRVPWEGRIKYDYVQLKHKLRCQKVFAGGLLNIAKIEKTMDSAERRKDEEKVDQTLETVQLATDE